ncbi:DUF421 domain-containing protein [Neobacillus cucumis]|uniref:DUF421 domain-containing protein n=1 Tax=Neobacillus cucumis TaxID=1740721 RepID=UPI00196686AA|nr:DUF421 domain-containing protein [Neobacillus cucumis]MBM7650969.1 uncharacterized membrane protein YcaP (DUF421 family) [Neobacillus cucumis]MED4226734.1 DUF421 domain-containing protein [Neobacillus cucumis]
MYLDIAIELIVGFLTLLVILKFLGKIQFSQITPFDFITGLVMGNFVGDAVFDDKINIPIIVFTVVIWGLLIYLVEKLTQVSSFFRLVFEGKPTLLIKNGQILYQNLKKNHVDLNQLQQLLRKQGYFSVFEAEYVILERDGQISVAPKHDYGAPTKKDLKIPVKQVNLPFAFIMDGKVIAPNLKEAGLTEDWLQKQLSQSNIKEYKEVLYAEWEKESGLKISKYN